MQLVQMKKTVKIGGMVALLAIVLLATIFLGKGVSNYMARASTCPTKNISATQVTSNSAIIHWETGEVTAGRVDYGTSSTNLTFSAPEASSGKSHNVPLTLLTPNTTYYYLIVVGNTRCDSSGQVCDKTCVPWTFTTAPVVPPQNVAATHTPVPIASPTQAVSPTVAIPTQSQSVSSGSPSSNLSAFCQQVVANIGASSKDATGWSAVKQYDIDGNGVINGLDIIKCQQSGK